MDVLGIAGIIVAAIVLVCRAGDKLLLAQQTRKINDLTRELNRMQGAGIHCILGADDYVVKCGRHPAAAERTALAEILMQVNSHDEEASSDPRWTRLIIRNIENLASSCLARGEAGSADAGRVVQSSLLEVGAN